MLLGGCDRWNQLPFVGQAAEPDVKVTAEEEAKALAGKLQFRSRGKLVVAIRSADLAQRARGEQPRVEDFFEKALVPFEGVQVAPLLDSAFGPDWTRSESLQFVCRDGSTAAFTPRQFREAKAYLVWRRLDRPDFVVNVAAEPGKVTELGPLYLIWDTSVDRDGKRPGAGNVWLPGVTAINLADATAELSAIALPADASPAAVAGFGHFKRLCASCHSLNGHGGQTGPELNAPISVTALFRPGMLEKYLDDPLQVRQRAQAPKVAKDVPDRAKVISEIAAFLQQLAQMPKN